MSKQNIIIYKTKDGKASVALYALDGDIWLNQKQLAELFATSKQNISLHALNILKENELEENSVVKDYLTTATDGKEYNVSYYSLAMILAIGFRVSGIRGTQFRQWANRHLHEYITKGFVMDDERLKNPDGRPDYFDEIDTLNRLAVIFLDTAELRTKNRINITMDFWRENAKTIIQSNDFKLLQNKGTVTKKQMGQLALGEYEKFDDRRKTYDAKLADKQDEEELRQLEDKIKQTQTGRKK